MRGHQSGCFFVLCRCRRNQERRKQGTNQEDTHSLHGNMRVLKQKRVLIALAALLAMMLCIGGISAYFTSTEDTTNRWTVGNVTIDLTEDEYDKTPPEEREDITPNKTFAKDPVITNTGINDAFVFLKFSVPKANVRIATLDGKAQDAEVQELFDYEINPEWVKVVEDTSAADKNTYVYAYGTDDACTPLVAEASTTSLFRDQKVTFINVQERQGLEGTTLEIPVQAYGIQTTDLTDDDVTNPLAVWKILNTQVETK